jgi:hypothetical protein
MDLKGNILDPCIGKGNVEVLKIDNALHFRWIDSQTNIIEQVTSLPKCAHLHPAFFSPLSEGKNRNNLATSMLHRYFPISTRVTSVGRALAIELHSTYFESQKYFFWMQEPANIENDYEIYSKLKFYLGDTNPPEEFLGNA